MFKLESINVDKVHYDKTCITLSSLNTQTYLMVMLYNTVKQYFILIQINQFMMKCCYLVITYEVHFRRRTHNILYLTGY